MNKTNILRQNIFQIKNTTKDCKIEAQLRPLNMKKQKTLTSELSIPTEKPLSKLMGEILVFRPLCIHFFLQENMIIPST